MDFKQMAMQLWPCWMLGILMVYLTWKSQYKEVLRVDLKGILKFARLLLIITVARVVLLKLLAPPEMLDNIRNISHMIPWQAILGVFWEDACHTMPLVLAGMMWAGSKWYPILSKIALVVVMASFGSGHIYQGWLAAIGLSFYIPMTIKLGKKYGFGTIMLCHIAYDMSTLFTLKWIAG